MALHWLVTDSVGLWVEMVKRSSALSQWTPSPSFTMLTRQQIGHCLAGRSPTGLTSRLHQDAAHCLLPRLAQLSWALRPARDDKSPSQPVLIGGPRGLYKGKEGGDWLCFTENIITPLNAGGPTEFPRPRNGDDHPGWEYMTWLTEALSPIWKPNCEA